MSLLLSISTLEINVLRLITETFSSRCFKAALEPRVQLDPCIIGILLKVVQVILLFAAMIVTDDLAPTFDVAFISVVAVTVIGDFFLCCDCHWWCCYHRWWCCCRLSLMSVAASFAASISIVVVVVMDTSPDTKMMWSFSGRKNRLQSSSTYRDWNKKTEICFQYENGIQPSSQSTIHPSSKIN